MLVLHQPRVGQPPKRLSQHGEGTAPGGIEVILDVVFNHTDEGNQFGPTFSFKGIDNLSYYLLVPWICSITWISRAAATRSTATIRWPRS